MIEKTRRPSAAQSQSGAIWPSFVSEAIKFCKKTTNHLHKKITHISSIIELFKRFHIEVYIDLSIKHKSFIEQNNIPIYVATPFPPLNFNQIGNTCPINTVNDEM